MQRPDLAGLVPQSQHHVRMLQRRRPGVGQHQAAGHAQVEHQVITACQIHDDVLGPPANGAHRPTRQASGERFRLGRGDYGRLPDINANDLPAAEGGVQVAGNCLHFG